MAEALRIAVIGAECTGKTSLVRALVPRLAALTGRRVGGVDEHLRQWCAQAWRTPRHDEQRAILEAQHSAVEAAAAAHEIVVCDTTGLMTAVYSALIFGDRSLEQAAVVLHGRMSATLLTALDLPWVADGIQRDGAHVREPVDLALRALLQRHRLPFAVIGGQGGARLAQALAALAPVLQGASRVAP